MFTTATFKRAFHGQASQPEREARLDASMQQLATTRQLVEDFASPVLLGEFDKLHHMLTDLSDSAAQSFRADGNIEEPVASLVNMA